MKIGVSVVTVDRPDTLALTLRKLRATFKNYFLDVVVVDNGSRDARMAEVLKDVQVIRLEVNQGLSVATNRGLEYLRSVGCDLLVHMDDDALIATSEEWADRVKAVFAGSPELGLLHPNRYAERIPRRHYDETRWGLGMFWVLRKEVHALVGGYDPQLLHQNECDLAVRVRMAGYTVGALPSLVVTHNDSGGPRSDLSLAREHLGCVQFRDKWAGYFRGRGWNYGTTPLYLMQHWPPDQEWYRRFAEAKGVVLNAARPEDVDTISGVGLTDDNIGHVGDRVRIDGMWFTRYVDLRNDYSHWEASDGYRLDREKAIERWFALTGERYTGYQWPGGSLPFALAAPTETT